MTSIFLSPATWDLCADISGNIAVASEPYALAQDAACACRTVLGELWYDTSQGIPYYANTLGQRVSLSTLRAQLIAAAMTVPGVASARVYFTSFQNRTLKGQVQVSNTSGNTTSASF